MPEEIDKRIAFSLLEVTKSITKTISERYTRSYWIKAEMNKLNYYRHSGHCYPELIEKKNGKIIAQMRCILWKDDYIAVNAKFKRILNEPLRDGIKILLLATIGYHSEYGLSLTIIDIDPSFTLGDLEREKQETIRRLDDDGLLRQNKTVPFPLLPQRIAIISVESSKGYADFIQVLEGAANAWGYRFFHMLFPSLLQGEKAIASITAQLQRIRRLSAHFDVVAIVRGGGGDTGLSCYNNYMLAKEVARFPLPVITGIGHATNETVVEMIASENAITPTKLAELLIQKFHDFALPVRNAERIISERPVRMLHDERTRFRSEVKLFRSLTASMLAANRSGLNQQAQALVRQTQFLFRNENVSLARNREKVIQGFRLFTKNAGRDLNNLEKNLANMSPENVLKRGYSITLSHGKAVTRASAVEEGAVLQTILWEGSVLSTVTSAANKENE